MKTFLDVGVGVLLFALALMVTNWFIPLPSLPEPLRTIVFSVNPLAIPAAFFCFYVLWHMVKTRHWGWLGLSVPLAPLTFPAYYFRIVRGGL